MQHTAQLDESLESAAPPILNRVGIHPLPHLDRNCSPALVGIDSRGHVALEMIYGEDGWLAQYVIAANGSLIAQRDEDYGRNHTFEPLDLADFSNLLPHLPAAVRDLVFAGGRWRGLRETDRVPEILHPLAVSEKMALNAYGFAGPILGIVESKVCAAAKINDHWHLLCRQVRIAFSVPVGRDFDGLPYDYDSLLLHFVEWFTEADGKPVVSPDQPLDQLIATSRSTFSPQPTDLLYDAINKRLFLIDNSSETAYHESASAAALHIFECL